jgi:hypothetical protein
MVVGEPSGSEQSFRDSPPAEAIEAEKTGSEAEQEHPPPPSRRQELSPLPSPSPVISPPFVPLVFARHTAPLCFLPAS